MIDPAMLNPTPSAQTKPGRSVVALTPQSAKVFSEEFGSALRSMNQKDFKETGNRRNTAQKSTSVHPGDGSSLVNDRTAANRSCTQVKGHDQYPTTQIDVAARQQPTDGTSNKSQPKSSIQRPEGGDAHEAEVAEGTHEGTVESKDDQAVDVLKNLLTMGALISGDTNDIEPKSERSNTALDNGPIEESEVAILFEHPVEQAVLLSAAQNLNGTAALAEANAQVTAENIVANLGDDAAAERDISTDEVTEASRTAAAITSAVSIPAPLNPVQASSFENLAPSTLGIDTNGTPAQEMMANGVGEVIEANQAASAEGIETPNQVESSETDPTANTEAVKVSTDDTAQTDTNEGQDENPIPQQSQPTQVTNVKADTTSTQPMVGGVQAPSQAGSLPGTATPVQPQSAGQPSQTPMLTPAQQMASALGALRRRGDGSYLTEITLNPKELGQVRLQVHVAGNTVSMQATALDPNTRTLLNTGLEDLSQALTDAGLESGHLDVNQGNGQGDGTDDDQPFAGFGANSVHVIDEESLTSQAGPADYITSTSVNTLA